MKIANLFHISNCTVLIVLQLSCQPNKNIEEGSMHQASSVKTLADTTLTSPTEIAGSQEIPLFKNTDFNLQFTYPGSYKRDQVVSAVGLNGEIKSTELMMKDSLSSNQIKIKYYPANQALKIYNKLKTLEGYEIVSTDFSETTLEKNEIILRDGKGNELPNPTTVKSFYFLSEDKSRLYEIQFRAEENNHEFIDKTLQSIDFLK